MIKRYIATLVDAGEKQIRALVVDQKQSKIVHDSVFAAELKEDIKQMFRNLYGNEVMFIEKEQPQPPQPENPNP